MSRASRGALPAVLRAIGLDSSDVKPKVRVIQGAACPRCRSELRFFVAGEFGQTFEQCTNTVCDLSVPHHPMPDEDAVKPKDRKHQRVADARRAKKAAANFGRVT